MEQGYIWRAFMPPKRHTDDMSPSQLTDAGEDSGSLDSDVTNPRRPDHEPRTGVESRKRNASWRAPETLVGFLGILIAFLVFLFGNNVTSRFGQTEASSDGRDNDPMCTAAKVALARVTFARISWPCTKDNARFTSCPSHLTADTLARSRADLTFENRRITNKTKGGIA